MKGRTIMFKQSVLSGALLASAWLLACGTGPNPGSELVPPADQQHIPVNAGQRIPPSNPQIATTDPQAVVTSDPQAVPPGGGGDTGGVEIDPEDKNCEGFCGAYEGSECGVKACREREICALLRVAGGDCVDVLLSGLACIQSAQGDCEAAQDRCGNNLQARLQASCRQYAAAANAEANAEERK